MDAITLEAGTTPLGRLESRHATCTTIKMEDGKITLDCPHPGAEQVFSLADKLRYFYASELLNEDGLPLAGALHGDGAFRGAAAQRRKVTAR